MNLRYRLLGAVTLSMTLAGLFTGCSLLGGPEASPTPEPTPEITPEPQQVVFSAVATPMPAAITPTPTPEPTATPIPFSQYAPTVNMTYEELVGSTDDMSKKGSELLKDG